jgi:uncharacterized integral membrane protein
MGEPGTGTIPAPPVTGAPGTAAIPPEDLEKFPFLITECSSGEDFDVKYTYLLGIVQEIRAEAKNLWELFCEMETEIRDKQSPDDIVRIVQPYQKIYEANKTEIDRLIAVSRTIIERDRRLNRHMGDEMRRIENYWERFTQFYPGISDAKSDTVLHSLQKCTGHLSEIIFLCSYRTIPDRLMDHLGNMTIPQAQNFYDLFQDEVCSKEQADSILQSLARSSKILRSEGEDEGVIGAVDTIQGLVYRVGTTTQQWISVAGILAACIAVWILCLAVLSVYAVFISPGWSVSGPKIMVFFIAMLGGAVFHVAIDILKEARSATKTRDIQAISDLLLWTHIKMFPIISSIVILGIGFLTIAIVTPSIGAETYFVAGYSIDSLGDLYLDRFDSVMTAKTDVLKKEIPVA